MDVNWTKCLAWVREDEGGNDDDPNDSGGRTSRGITQREYDAWREERGLVPKHRDVWQAFDSEIDAIYRGEYWKPECAWLPTGADYLFFDLKVNAGPHRAIIILQEALGVAPDGRIGPVTRLELAKADEAALIKRFSNEKRVFYTHLAMSQPKDRKFLHGWLNRADHVEQRANTLIPKRGVANV